MPENVRLYFASSFQHGGVAGLLNPPGRRAGGMCEVQNAGQRLGADAACAARRARRLGRPRRGAAEEQLLHASGQDARVSRRGAAAFPAIPGVRFPTVLNESRAARFRAGASVDRRTRRAVAADVGRPVSVVRPEAGQRRAGRRRHPAGRSRPRRRRPSPAGTCARPDVGQATSVA